MTVYSDMGVLPDGSVAEPPAQGERYARFTERSFGVDTAEQPDGSLRITKVFIDMMDPVARDGIRVYWGWVVSDPDEEPRRLISLIDRRAEFPQAEVPETWP